MMISDITVEVSDTTMLNRVQMPVTKKILANISSKKQETSNKVSTIFG